MRRAVCGDRGLASRCALITGLTAMLVSCSSPAAPAHSPELASPTLPSDTTQRASGQTPSAVADLIPRLTGLRVRSMLVPSLAAEFNGGRLFPAGTRLTPLRGSWHQVGDFANVCAALAGPRSGTVEIGLTRAHTEWKVLFVEYVS